jgi:hypothetical protein
MVSLCATDLSVEEILHFVYGVCVCVCVFHVMPEGTAIISPNSVIISL